MLDVPVGVEKVVVGKVRLGWDPSTRLRGTPLLIPNHHHNILIPLITHHYIFSIILADIFLHTQMHKCVKSFLPKKFLPATYHSFFRLHQTLTPRRNLGLSLLDCRSCWNWSKHARGQFELF